MLRPAKILQYLAAGYVVAGAFGMVFVLGSEAIDRHGFFTKGGPPERVDTATMISFVVWLVCAAWCGWRTMDRVAEGD